MYSCHELGISLYVFFVPGCRYVYFCYKNYFTFMTILTFGGLWGLTCFWRLSSPERLPLKFTYDHKENDLDRQAW